MDECRGPSVKRNKPGTERQMPHRSYVELKNVKSRSRE
jgi:hypothetical protein